MDLEQARARRLEIRAEIRARNSERPRCAGCGNDFPIHDGEEITPEMMTTRGFEYLGQSDLRAGDLLCFWCLHEITDVGSLFQWGHA